MWGRRAGLLAVLVSGAYLVWIEAGMMLRIIEDDVSMMAASREIADGHWRVIWTPHAIHFFPLFRLARLPFDLNFPDRQSGFHAVVTAAHLLSTVVLFALARHHLRGSWAALATAALFAWSRVGNEALTWKAASPFALVWPFLLLAAWCLTRRGVRWGWGAVGWLGIALGFDSSAALLAFPGLVAGAWIRNREEGRRALLVCGSVGLLAGAGWLVWVLPKVSMSHHWEAADPSAGIVTRLRWAAGDTARAYGHQLGSGLHAALAGRQRLVLAVLAAMALWLRRHLAWRWILGMFLLTVLPLFVILLIRRHPGIEQVGRYAYQSFTFWAVMVGSVLDAVLRRLEGQPRRRAAAAALSAALVVACWGSQLQGARHAAQFARQHPATQQTFWQQWKDFFRIAASHRVESGRPLRLPPIEAHPNMSLHLLFQLCYPRGLAGLVVEPGAPATPEDEYEYWKEVERARRQLPGFRPLRHTQAH